MQEAQKETAIWSRTQSSNWASLCSEPIIPGPCSSRLVWTGKASLEMQLNHSDRPRHVTSWGDALSTATTTEMKLPVLIFMIAGASTLLCPSPVTFQNPLRKLATQQELLVSHWKRVHFEFHQPRPLSMFASADFFSVLHVVLHLNIDAQIPQPLMLKTTLPSDLSPLLQQECQQGNHHWHHSTSDKISF